MAFDLFALSKESFNDLKERFYSKFEKRGKDDCWEWKARKNKPGYGSIVVQLEKKQYSYLAHRLSWVLYYNSPIPPTLFCCHSCDNPSCVNPTHIMLATHKNNMQDAKIKGRLKNGYGPCRQARTEKAKKRHLEIAKDIKNGLSQKEIRQKHKIRPQLLWAIKKRPYVIEMLNSS